VTSGGDRLILLLPERRRLAGPLDLRIASALGRGKRTSDGGPGETAQLERMFWIRECGHGWPMAAITRAFDCGDAAGHAWLRADPANVRAEMSGARLMACGDFGLDADEVEAFLGDLRALFDEAGLPISSGHPGRWYLRLPADAAIPEFTAPAEALGADILPLLPAGPDGRRWRALMNEAQVMLHNHPRNERRIARGLLPVNSLWFWGGGVLPPTTWPSMEAVVTGDDELRALAKLARLRETPGESGNVLVDCRHERDFARLQAGPLAQGLASLGTRYERLVLDFADGASFEITHADRWRVWRRAVDVRA
jgi:hypothetical protein